MGRGADQIDFRLVERMRAQNASWCACARACSVSEDLVRRHCDPAYERPDLTEAAARAPKLASGRENRPVSWAEPTPVRTPPVPPCSNAKTMNPSRPPKERAVTPQPATPPPVAAAPPLPSADQVARAVIAAAIVLQEDPLILGEPVSGARMCKLSRRYRFAAYAALKAKFAGAPDAAIGRMTALPNPSAAVFSLKQAQGSRWWAELGDQAVKAAIAALGA